MKKQFLFLMFFKHVIFVVDLKWALGVFRGNLVLIERLSFDDLESQLNFNSTKAFEKKYRVLDEFLKL